MTAWPKSRDSMADARLYEERLRDHLLKAVVGGITGRDGAALPEKPYRVIFAGVLHPTPRGTAPSVATTSLSPSRASAIGMDFRVRPGTGTLAFRCNISFAIYYPTFPDLDAAQQQLASQHVSFVEPELTIEEDNATEDQVIEGGELFEEAVADENNEVGDDNAGNGQDDSVEPQAIPRNSNDKPNLSSSRRIRR